MTKHPRSHPSYWVDHLPATQYHHHHHHGRLKHLQGRGEGLKLYAGSPGLAWRFRMEAAGLAVPRGPDWTGHAKATHRRQLQKIEEADFCRARGCLALSRSRCCLRTVKGSGHPLCLHRSAAAPLKQHGWVPSQGFRQPQPQQAPWIWRCQEQGQQLPRPW